MHKNVPVVLSEYQFKDIFVGQEYAFDHCITESMVHAFVELSGDHNPLHIDSVYAQNTEFNGTVVHGLLCSSLFSRLVGMHLPGKNALYLSQELKFHAPIREGMDITVKGTVAQKIDALQAIKIKTEIVSAIDGKVFVDGFAIVKVRS